MGTTPSPSERGASAVEYGLLIAGIAMVIAVAFFALGGMTVEMFDHTCDEVSAQVAAPTC